MKFLLVYSTFALFLINLGEAQDTKVQCPASNAMSSTGGVLPLPLPVDVPPTTYCFKEDCKVAAQPQPCCKGSSCYCCPPTTCNSGILPDTVQTSICSGPTDPKVATP